MPSGWKSNNIRSENEKGIFHMVEASQKSVAYFYAQHQNSSAS